MAAAPRRAIRRAAPRAALAAARAPDVRAHGSRARLVAAWRGDDLASLPPRVEQARAVLSARYRVDLDSVLVNLYRDGQDAVAWHGDTVRKTLPLAVVCTVSLGHRRRFRVRPRGGGQVVLELTPGEGDLVVMGGRTQHDWEHTVPRERVVGSARMSITLRHSHPASSSGWARPRDPTDRGLTSGQDGGMADKEQDSSDGEKPDGKRHIEDETSKQMREALERKKAAQHEAHGGAGKQHGVSASRGAGPRREFRRKSGG